ncbi:hypothetical protein PGT21_012488 [Puccinia graminis f. sp. tritici]|uniref:Uncharacterized protein n=1 Tax=Puccinia graminis f. sp. tritici TaxID=56615 RepID=A0A5B0PXC9_PUCGR|nr:hypothetical protein PGTUg99_003703 [Puccinia graminis f. sp. tritici]KAA1105585.1 hypothetical protein PGT21_012488 [Puccinia graminis f. sp. tritici]
MLRRSPTSVRPGSPGGEEAIRARSLTRLRSLLCSHAVRACPMISAVQVVSQKALRHFYPGLRIRFRSILSRYGSVFLLEPGEPTKLVDSLPHPSPSSFSSSFSSSCSPPYGRLVSSTQLRSPLPPAPPQSPHISRHQEESLGQKTQTQVLGSTSFRRIRDSQRRRKSRET